MSIHIIKQGLLDTFQDAGRYGYQHIGINPGGAMDRVALLVANALTGNPPNEAALEMHFPAAEIRFNADALIALTGADFTATINHQNVPVHRPILVRKDNVLQFKEPVKGARVYCSVRGGFGLTSWLDSCSTNTVCKMGGHEGRPLQDGDTIPFKAYHNYPQFHGHEPVKLLPFHANMQAWKVPGSIQILPGKHLHMLTAQSEQHLHEGFFTIGYSSNRMGYRLQSQPLALRQQVQVISSAVTMGTIQLLPDGQLIILMADHQTTGGYPVIGHVLSTHLPALAQCTAGQQIQFQVCEAKAAARQLSRLHRHLLELQNACTFRLSQFV